jgi:hypothetical protein
MVILTYTNIYQKNEKSLLGLCNKRMCIVGSVKIVQRQEKNVGRTRLQVNRPEHRSEGILSFSVSNMSSIKPFKAGTVTIARLLAKHLETGRRAVEKLNKPDQSSDG